MKWLRIVFTLCVAFSAALDAAAQGYPDKPIRFIVPFPPGGGTDIFARVIGSKLTDMWGQPVLIDNRGGAQGNLGTALGAKAPPDGYTITLAVTGTLAINPHLFSKAGFEPLRSFAAITRGTEEVWVLVAHPSVPAKTARQLGALAAKRPGKLSYASPSPAGHLLGELFNHTMGTKIVNIPYKGAGPAIIDLIAGNVDIIFSNPPGPMPHIKTGKLRALMVFGPKRFDGLPTVPTALESGYADFNLTGWYGVVAPAATPADVVLKLNAGIVRALQSPDVLERMQAAAQVASPSTPEQFAEQIRSDHERWGRIVKSTGAKVE